MPEPAFLRHAAPAAAICAVVATLYLSAGLIAVLVAAALFDCALIGVEHHRRRRPTAPQTADGAPRKQI